MPPSFLNGSLPCRMCGAASAALPLELSQADLRRIWDPWAFQAAFPGEDHTDPIPELGDGIDQEPDPAWIGAEPLREGRKPDGQVDLGLPTPRLHRDRLPTRWLRPHARAALAHPAVAHRRRPARDRFGAR